MDDKLIKSTIMLAMIGLARVNAENLLLLISNLNILQVLILVLTGSIMIEKVELEGWKQKMPIYIIKCSKHGYQLTYPQGHMANLVCPKCALE